MRIWNKVNLYALLVPLTALAACDPEPERLPEDADSERGTYLYLRRTGVVVVQHREPTSFKMEDCVDFDPESVTEEPQSWPWELQSLWWQWLVPDSEQLWLDKFIEQQGKPEQACEQTCWQYGYEFTGQWYLDLDTIALEPPKLEPICKEFNVEGEIDMETAGSTACECEPWRPVWEPVLWRFW